MSQSQAQAVAWQVASVGLVALAVAVGNRTWKSGLAGGVMAGCLSSALFHWPPAGYPILVLLVLIGWATVWGLIQLSPSAEWIERSVVWLALANVVYALSQWAGYDPLFETGRQLTGCMSRPNWLAVLWLVALPLARRWQRVVLVGAILLIHNWTAMIGLSVLGAVWTWQRKPEKALFGLGGVLLAGAVSWWVFHPTLWTMKAAPRLLTWQETFGQALWSPVWGYGLGARSAMTKVGGMGDIGYNIWLEAFHAGGVLILAPLLWALWRVGKSMDSPARTALLLIAAAGCTQSLWHSTGWVVITLALFAAWELRRMDAV